MRSAGDVKPFIIKKGDMMQGDMMNNPYKYAEQPFTVAIAQELILELCDGETLKKSEIMRRVFQEHHLKQGGLEYAGRQSYDMTFSDALNNLKKQGMATNEGTPHGHWKLYGGSPPDEPRAVSPPDDPPDEPRARCVYIYYYPSYRELAELKGEDKWPCKIGCTERDAETRIKEQGTGMPEHAKQEIIIETDDPRGLEQMIRSSLKRKEMHIQDAPGDEWYLINSEIAKKIAEAFEDFQKTLDDVI